MRVRYGKQLLAIVLAGTLTVSLAACNKKVESSADKTDTAVVFDQVKLGEHTDLKANLKFLTHKTDIVDTTFKEYVSEFQKMYPNISIEYEGITNYANDITTRLTTGDWGDICMIPVTVDKNELKNYFVTFGNLDEMSKEYTMLFNYSYDNKVYGLPSMGNTQGIVYNKRIFEEAGVKEIPKTPDEFLDALSKIKEHTDAIPLYTNFAAGWTMTAWDAYIDACATGQADFAHEGRVKGKNPFADRGDQTGPYAVYNLLYEAVSRGLTEEDPTTTDWEGSKARLNRGEIACMALGSWSIAQMKAAAEHGDDVAYMPFPISVNGKQYTSVSPDYNYGINCNSSADNQLAAMLYVKWLIDKSGFEVSQGGIPIKVNAQLPDFLKAFDGVGLLYDLPTPAGEETLGNDVNNESELGVNVSGGLAKAVVEAAINGQPGMKELAAEWDEKWTAAQEKCGITH
ncbi:carbohydrate ABC transporter substrate-binding protein (CUT1 family) [Lacrimispora xylanisolvens]|uniref:Carbohydrate ABC transporter substrate-binding protein (CUT1 family) n=1 Tax=Lacrimispora xylanisolvens TaxID=384636 RepID=A0A2S6HWL9_9FIRM|nr:ABC transporter substrate-binding protein [Hungatella xylanolytica]MBE5988117.1 carbohydrate ABC transporter substrate-binding protein [Paenibacillaceae bacterium]PPK82404.1 carbohydrate ABC transporter substrate-binding protein (CUT1 family) [Hungatella xylanolytica]